RAKKRTPFTRVPLRRVGAGDGRKHKKCGWTGPSICATSLIGSMETPGYRTIGSMAWIIIAPRCSARRSCVSLRSGSPTHLLSRSLENGDQCAVGQLTNSCLRRWLITAVYLKPHTFGHLDAGVVTQPPHLM